MSPLMCLAELRALAFMPSFAKSTYPFNRRSTSSSLPFFRVRFGLVPQPSDVSAAKTCKKTNGLPVSIFGRKLLSLLTVIRSMRDVLG
jgi:hypothetical protein